MTVCNGCGRSMKVSRLKIHKTLATMLVSLQQLGNGWHHIETFRPTKHGSGRDFSILKHWNLVESKPANSDEDKRTSGMYRLTDSGKAFVLGTIAKPKYVYVFNNKVIETSDTVVVIGECKPFQWSQI